MTQWVDVDFTIQDLRGLGFSSGNSYLRKHARQLARKMRAKKRRPWSTLLKASQSEYFQETIRETQNFPKWDFGGVFLQTVNTVTGWYMGIEHEKEGLRVAFSCRATSEAIPDAINWTGLPVRKFTYECDRYDNEFKINSTRIITHPSEVLSWLHVNYIWWRIRAEILEKG